MGRTWTAKAVSMDNLFRVMIQNDQPWPSRMFLPPWRTGKIPEDPFQEMMLRIKVPGTD